LWSFLSGYCTWVVFFFLSFSCGLIWFEYKVW
jgi:hypothetical protein